MPTPFPGMDPSLEQPGIWQQVNADLIVDIRRFLAPLLRPRYYVAIEQLTYLTVLPPPQSRVGVPDISVVKQEKEPEVQPVSGPTTIVAEVAEPVIAILPQPQEVKQRYLEIHDTATEAVITTIEILSPGNKVGAEGRQQYERKRLKILGSLTNLVEIDLLRIGNPMPMDVSQKSDYRIVISRSHQRPQAEVYLFTVRQSIPDFVIPLQPDEEAPILPLNQLLHDLYDQSSYDLMIDYHKPAVPPLSTEDADWAADLMPRDQR